MFCSFLGGSEGCLYFWQNGKLSLCERGLSDANFAAIAANDHIVTWQYLPALDSISFPVEYMKLRCAGRCVGDVCPSELGGEWQEVTSRIEAFLRSFYEIKISLTMSDLCKYQAIPEELIFRYLALQTKIIQHVYENYRSPTNYDLMLNLWKLSYKLAKQKLNLNFGNIQQHILSKRARRLIAAEPYVCYDIFTSRTGRLKTQKSSFPVLSFDKELRACLVPRNDLLIELDFSAFEPSCFLRLLGQPLPEGDLHAWHQRLWNMPTREAAKQAIMHWLYGSSALQSELETIYCGSELKELFWNKDKQEVNTLFGRKIENVDEFHAIPYIVQSTAADIMNEQMVQVDKLLAQKRSRIVFSMHDALLLDFAEEDKNLIKEIMRTMKNTRLGELKVRARIFKKHYGEYQTEYRL
jgi:hypothetical protein